jgi:hypothetical protein
MLGIAVATGLLAGLIAGFTSPIFVAAELAVIAVTLLVDRLGAPAMERWVRGAAGEERVGRILDALDGWQVYHDLATGRGNIDHVIIGPAGVFTVETKSQAGRIAADRIQETWLKQAYAQTKSLQEAIDRPVTPMLVFTRAFLTPAVTPRRGMR